MQQDNTSKLIKKTVKFKDPFINTPESQSNKRQTQLKMTKKENEIQRI